MSSPSPGTTPPPPKDPREQQPKPGSGDPITAFGLTSAFALLAIVPILFTIIFHLGAAFLSYKKYGSIGWAILNFFFAVFYYPYYAFALNDGVTESSQPSLLGGRRRRR